MGGLHAAPAGGVVGRGAVLAKQARAVPLPIGWGESAGADELGAAGTDPGVASAGHASASSRAAATMPIARTTSVVRRSAELGPSPNLLGRTGPRQAPQPQEMGWSL